MKGSKKHSLYTTWCNIKQRCYNTKHPAYKYYGGKGVEMSDTWRLSFDSFCEDMGLKPSSKHSIERIDPNGNYESSNCKWAEGHEQSRNKSNNVIIDYDGQSMCAKDWEMIIGISRQTIIYRYNNGIDIKEGKKNKSKEEIKERDRNWRIKNKQNLNNYAKIWYKKHKKAKQELL